MKKTTTYLGVLVFGIGVGFGLSLLVRIHQKRQTEHFVNDEYFQARENETVERWRVEAPAALGAYYHGSVPPALDWKFSVVPNTGLSYPVPLPNDVDFSSNTWQKLNYWEKFSNAFLSYQSPMVWPRAHITTYGTCPDPWAAVREFEGWPNGNGTSPWQLAMDALTRLRQGIPFEEVRSWVGQNVRYPDDHAFRSYMDSVTNKVISP